MAPDAPGNGRRADRIAGPAGSRAMSPLRRRAALLLVGALLTGSCTGAFAASKLFKCVDGGRTVYQQQACSPSALPEAAPSVPAHASGPSAMARANAPVAAPAASQKVKTPPSPASSALATPR
jgi:hypothetical protein